jgi:hypothetical protein
MELDELWDLRPGGRIVELLPLLDAETFEQLTN